MDKRVIIQGVNTATPATSPATGDIVRQLACDNRGILWVNLVANNIEVPGQANNADGVSATATLQNIPMIGYTYLWDGSNWDRARTQNLAGSSFTPDSSVGGLQVAAVMYADASGTKIPVKTLSVTNLQLFQGFGAAMVGSPGEWAINHAPAANTVATISRAAVANSVHICRGFSVSINAVAAIAAPLVVNLRDGATGAGTILWTERLMAPVGTTFTITREGLNIVGSTNTAMTLEFTAAPGATNFENVNLNGITVANTP